MANWLLTTHMDQDSSNGRREEMDLWEASSIILGEEPPPMAVGDRAALLRPGRDGGLVARGQIYHVDRSDDSVRKALFYRVKFTELMPASPIPSVQVQKIPGWPSKVTTRRHDFPIPLTDEFWDSIPEHIFEAKDLGWRARWDYEEGESVIREAVHDRYSGAPRGRIAPASRSHNIFVFLNDNSPDLSKNYFWCSDGALTFPGKRETTIATSLNDNDEILRHARHGKTLRIFLKESKKGGIYTYLGEFIVDQEDPIADYTDAVPPATDMTSGRGRMYAAQSYRIPLIRAFPAAADPKNCRGVKYWSSSKKQRKPSLPVDHLRTTGSDSAEIARLLQGSDKAQIIDALRSVLGNSLTQADLDIISNRKGQLEIFRKYLSDASFFEQRRGQLRDAGQDSGPEAVWQRFFEDNPWIFGYGLNLISCASYDDKKLEQITTGASRFRGAGKRSDGVLRTRGIVSSLLFCEIKRHDHKLIAPKPYRDPDVYAPSNEVTGAVSQVQKTAEKAVRDIREFLHRQYSADGNPTDLEVSTIKPRQVVVVGSNAEFETEGSFNPEKIASFELYRRSKIDVEVITYDELYERTCFIVQDG